MSTSDLWPLGLMRRRAGAAAAVPAEILRPGSVAEVVQILGQRRRVVPLGGGSGVCGAVDPAADDVLLDLGGLDRFEVDEANLLVRAEAGVNGMALEQELNRRGLTLGHYPSSLPAATVGGLVSTRSSGQESTLHGNIEDMVAALTVVLAGGRLVGPRAPVRSAVGPDLQQIFIGAEGGLGVIVEAVLRVHRLPDAVIGAGWRMASVASGLDAMRSIMQAGLRPQVARLYDPVDSNLQGEPEGCLLVTAAAGFRAAATADAEAMAAAIGKAGGEALGSEPWERWLRHRFDLSAARLRDLLEPAGSYVDTIDVAATWTALPGLYERTLAHLSAHAQLAMCHFSHATPHGACAYFTMAGSATGETAAVAAYEECWRGAMEAALEAGATIGHHHGVGQARGPWLEAELGGWAGVWGSLRTALDPDRRLNPNALGGRL